MFEIAAIIGCAYLFQAVFGFGAALIAVVVISAILPAQSVVAMIPMTILVACLLTVLTDIRAVRLSEVVPVVLKSMPGIVVGGILLGRISDAIIVAMVCCLVIAYSAFSLRGGVLRVGPRGEMALASGAGFAIAITGFGILFVPLVMRRLDDPREFRISLNAMWLMLGSIRLPIYAAAGLVTRQVIFGALASIPAILVSLVVGSWIAGRIDPARFRRSGLVFLGILAVLRLVLLVAT